MIARLGYSRTLVRYVALDVGYRYSQGFFDESEDDFYRNIVSIGLPKTFGLSRTVIGAINCAILPWCLRDCSDKLIRASIGFR